MTQVRAKDIPLKFSNPFTTLDGSARASVNFDGWHTLWFNTGTLCNIECANCYIKSSPTNDDLLYLSVKDIEPFLSEMKTSPNPAKEIGFTGGEPFMNPEMINMARLCLEDGYEVLILTNAMQPMMRPRVQLGLLELHAKFGNNLALRISLDHFRKDEHDLERGDGSFEKTLIGMRWLRDHGISMSVAGRALWMDGDQKARAGYAELFEKEGFDIDAHDLKQTVLFPEMDEAVDVPEITTACWGILGKKPNDIMCSSSRMVVKRKSTNEARVIACTLLPYDKEFDLGSSLKEARKPVYLNHPHCAKFCVLGGASCSA